MQPRGAVPRARPRPGHGVIGAPGHGSGVLAAPARAGQSAVVVIDASCFRVGQLVQLDENDPVARSTAECRLITRIDGRVLTLAPALEQPHRIDAPVTGVTAPFTHSF